MLGELKGSRWVQFVGKAREVRVSQGKERGRSRSREAATGPGRKGKEKLRAATSWEPQGSRGSAGHLLLEEGPEEAVLEPARLFLGIAVRDVSEELLKCSQHPSPSDASFLPPKGGP